MIFKVSKEHPQQRYIYAVTKGAYLGELLVFMTLENNSLSFLSLPDMKIREIPYDKFDYGLKEGIVDIVEKLPKDVYETCCVQYKKNKSLPSQASE